METGVAWDGEAFPSAHNNAVNVHERMMTEEEIYEVLRECYDPEIPVNIVDLGLVYGVAIEAGTVNVQMTLTAPGFRWAQ